ncbi:MAG TPA: hypothetical protein DCX14_13645 [Flavobacteriales bacterium]|jgi:hypothetical protein|nr:hypothetical protein [Flavobacteriales bacterium]HAW21218.1 hypothetical protein [Flavobacteriales bacterium]
MKRLSLLLLVSFILFSFSGPFDGTKTLSESFYKASMEKSFREVFHESMENLNSDSPLAIAYLGASKAMLAETVSNPYSKYNYFVDGKELIEKAIKLDPNDAEIRYVRFMIQSHTPAFLGYSNETKEDFERIVLELTSSQQSAIWVSDLRAYLISSKSSFILPES